MNNSNTTNQLRRSFLQYFSNQKNKNGGGGQHLLLPSASLIPSITDQSLLFTSAGMVPFKQHFLGNSKPPSSKICTVQRCLRVGGKHNDLENVGFTDRHQTLFEMLGNFSFGGYFKEEAILLAWNFLTKEISIPKDKLRISVFEQDPESEELWKKLTGLGQNQIVRMGAEDNFWSMGDEPDSPCGPCSEIYFDRGEDIQHERFLEIWNLVFMQYKNGATKGSLLPLPLKCVDTGMGLERLASVMQGVDSNFDIDSMQHIIQKAKDLVVKPKGINMKAPLRVIADHSRAAAFLIADGVLPSNVGRGYVLRRLIRRAAGFGHKIGIPTEAPFMSSLLPEIELSLPGDVYPELGERRAMIASILNSEEEVFSRTLERGMKEFDKLISTKPKRLNPKDVFFLYDTFGFPIDLVTRLANDENIQVDMDGVRDYIQSQKKNAQSTNSTLPLLSSNSSSVPVDKVVFSWASNNIIPKFVGYNTLKVHNTRVLAVAPCLSKNEHFWISLEETPFYAQGGGQEGDHGQLELENGIKLKVIDTLRPYGAESNVMLVECPSPVSVKVGDVIACAEVQYDRRERHAVHHTATHILHAALRHRFGPSVTQAGSLVGEDRLRFDFSHSKQISKEDVKSIEDWMNAFCLTSAPVIAKEVSLDHAKQAGAMMLFSEKYNPDKVRMVSILSTKEEFTSIELCGGTHVRDVSQCYPVKIIAQSSVAAGTRRIELSSGKAAIARYQKLEPVIDRVMNYFKLTEAELNDLDEFNRRLDNFQAQAKSLQKEVTKLEKVMIESSLLLPGREYDLPNGEEEGGGGAAGKVLIHQFDSLTENEDTKLKRLRLRVEYLKKQNPLHVHIVFCGSDVVCGLDPKFHPGKNATEILRQFLGSKAGKGGGSNQMATMKVSNTLSFESFK